MIKNLKSQLLRHEGLRLKPYKDTTGNITIGVGRNLSGKGISRVEAFLLFQNDIAEVFDSLDKNLPWWKTLDEVRQQALANLCFNTGIGTLLKFKNTLQALKLGHYKAAANGIRSSKYATQVGKRAEEIAEMIETGLLKD